MTKAITMLTVGLSIVLALGTVYAQPKPAPTPGAGSGSASGSGSGSGSDTGEKERPGTNESLQNGGDARPWASGVAPAEQRVALDKFHEANVELNNGLFAKAAEKYFEALKHWDHPAIHYNLALAQMELAQPIEAYDNLTTAIKYGDAPLQSKDKFDSAKHYLVLLDQQIANIEVKCDKAGAKVSVDGKEVFKAPGTYVGKVRVGKHTIVAELEGHPTKINAPFIGPGEHYRIELQLYTVAELTRYHRKWDATWMPYVVMGGGVVIGFVGGLFEQSASNSYKQYDSDIVACNMNNKGCVLTSTLSDERKSGDTKRTIGYVGYGVGAAAVVAGAVLAILNRPEAYQIRSEDLEQEKEEPAVSVAPVVAPGFTGASVVGRF